MVRSYPKILLLVVLLCGSQACTLTATKQDPDKAAASAVEFAKAALIDRDMDRAFSLLDPEAQANAPKQRFAEILTQMNAAGWPTVVTATEFEPIPGSEAMNIYLKGENGPDTFYFRVPMRGDANAGYKPVGILRGQYAPSASRQPLQGKHSTNR